MKHYRRQAASQHGFTMVELVMTIVLVGILAAVALPRFFDLLSFNNRFIYDDVLAAARYGQKFAVGSGCATRLITTTSSYRLLRSDNCGVGSSATFTNSTTYVVPGPDGSAGANSMFDVTALPDSVSLSAATITFYPNGTANADTTISAGGNTITITAATGYVR